MRKNAMKAIHGCTEDSSFEERDSCDNPALKLGSKQPKPERCEILFLSSNFAKVLTKKWKSLSLTNTSASMRGPRVCFASNPISHSGEKSP